MKIKLMDPFVQLIFCLPWSIIRKLEYIGAARQPKKDVYKITDIDIEGEEKNKIQLTVYYPNDKSNLPIVIYYHGGGFAIGSRESSDSVCRDLCNRIECIFVNVEYRLAPEHLFPKGFNDAYFATKWIYENASSINGDPNRMVVMGESAGGNFAAGICLQNSERSQADFKLVHQVLVYPSSDLRPSPVRPSRKIFYDGWFYSSRQSNKFRAVYFEDHEQADNYRASPFVYEGSMRGVPEAFILVAEMDPLRDEGFDYGKKLTKAGIKTKVHSYKATHGFFEIKIDETTRALNEVVETLKQVFFSSEDKKDVVLDVN